MKVKFFYKKDCPRCPEAKEVLSKIKLTYESIDVDTVDGMAEAAYFDVFSTPSVLVLNDSGKELKSWRGVPPSLEEIKKVL